jgi:hypothetical protein
MQCLALTHAPKAMPGLLGRESGDKPIGHVPLKGNFRVPQHGSISQTWKGLFAWDHSSVLAGLEIE